MNNEANKENGSITPSRKSGSRRSTGQMNIVSNHLNYVKSLELENEELKADRENLSTAYQHQLSEAHRINIAEIDDLRTMVDQLAIEKADLKIKNDDLQKSVDSLQIQNINQKDKINSLECEKCELEQFQMTVRRKCIDYDSKCKELSELKFMNKTLTDDMKREVIQRVDLENKIMSLEEKVEYYKRHYESAQSHLKNPKISTVKMVDEKLFNDRVSVEVEKIHEELTDEFDRYKEEVKFASQKRLDEVLRKNTELMNKLNAVNSELLRIEAQYNDKIRVIVAKDAELRAMNESIQKNDNIVSQLRLQHEEQLIKLTEQVSKLQEELQLVNSELHTVNMEKTEAESNLSIIYSYLEEKQSHSNYSSQNSPKRRKLARTIHDKYEINAWCNDRMKVMCDDEYNGDYFILLNDCETKTNLNEWKLSIEDGDEKSNYTFAERFVLPGQALKVWNVDNNEIVDDDNNLKLNIKLPISECFSCSLFNDMDGLEASFKLTKPSHNRSIIRRNKREFVNDKDKEEGCSMM